MKLDPERQSTTPVIASRLRARVQRRPRTWRPTPTRRRSPPLMPFMPSVSSPISVCWHAARSCTDSDAKHTQEHVASK